MAGGRIGPSSGRTHTLILIEGQLWLSPTFFTSLRTDTPPFHLIVHFLEQTTTDCILHPPLGGSRILIICMSYYARKRERYCKSADTPLPLVLYRGPFINKQLF